MILGARKPVYPHELGVTTTDRPKSVRNRVIEIVGDVFVLSICFLEFSVGIVAFVIELS